MTAITPEIWQKSWDDHVKAKLDFPTENIGQLYLERMEKFPNKVACWFMEREITWAELVEYVKKFCTFLQNNGVKKGDVVGINLPNCPQYLIALFGSLLAGATTSGVNPLLSENEIAYQLNDSKAKVLVTLDAIYEHRVTKILDELPNLEIVIGTNVSEFMGLSPLKVFLGKRLVKKIPYGKVFEWPGKKVITIKDILETTDINVKPVTVDPQNDICYLQYTGGTTGFPKGTILTHANMQAQHTQFENWLKLKEGEDVILSAFPAFHSAGLLTATQTTWACDSQILIPNPRDTDHLIAEMIDKKPTILANVPTLYMYIQNNPKSKEIPEVVLDNIRVYISSAAPFPEESIRNFEKHMRAENKVLECYGMTETSPLIVSNPFWERRRLDQSDYHFR